MAAFGGTIRPTESIDSPRCARHHPEPAGQHAAGPRAGRGPRLDHGAGGRELPPVPLSGHPLDHGPERRVAELEAAAEGAARALQGRVPEADVRHHRHGVSVRAAAVVARGRRRCAGTARVRGPAGSHPAGDEDAGPGRADQAEDRPGLAEPDHRGQPRAGPRRGSRRGRRLEGTAQIRIGHRRLLAVHAAGTDVPADRPQLPGPREVLPGRCLPDAGGHVRHLRLRAPRS